MKENKIIEINKQLFEDVLAGKLEGNFVLKNGFRVNSNRLCKKGGKKAIYCYWLKGFSPLYTVNGVPNSIFDRNYTIVDFIPKYKTVDLEMLEYCRKDFEFMQTLLKAINNMNILEIEIPEGKIVDWDESKEQNKIVLKDKQLTYENICNKLYENNPTFEHQFKCLLAKNRLANVAKYLNDGWKPSFEDISLLILTSTGISISRVANGSCASDCGSIWFKSTKLAQQAIEILGEETVKLALEPLGI